MQKPTTLPRPWPWAVRMICLLSFVGAVGVASASSGPESNGDALLQSARSVTHLLGIVASLLLVYYAVKARRKFSGGVFGESATYVIVGGTLFVVAFTLMELEHGFGINAFSFVADMQLKMAINMVLFSATVFAFGLAFYRTANVLKG